jgi:hypothetical protein
MPAIGSPVRKALGRTAKKKRQTVAPQDACKSEHDEDDCHHDTEQQNAKNV